MSRASSSTSYLHSLTLADDLSFKMVRSKAHLICKDGIFNKNCTLMMLKSGGGFMPFHCCRPRLVSIELAHAGFLREMICRNEYKSHFRPALKNFIRQINRRSDPIKSGGSNEKNEEKTQINGTLGMWGKCAHGEWTKTGESY